jgi:hypothetical protein
MDPLQMNVRPDSPEETRDSLIAISQLEPADSYCPDQINAKDCKGSEEDKEEYRLKLISITYPDKSPLDAEKQPVNGKV